MKYYVTINDNQYEVEVEKGKAELLNISAVQQAAPTPQPVAAAPAPVAAAPAPVAVAAPVGSGEVVAAPMPGNILSVNVQQGQTVKSGEILVVMEAMKMENEILAPRDGVVSQIATQKGSLVDTGTPLLYLQ